jgi:type I restriction enzyme S subunit
VLVRHNEVIHPGQRTGEGTFVGLEHVEPNSGRRIGSMPIDLGNLTGRKPTFRRGQIVYGYLRPYLNKVWIAEFDGYSSVDQFAFDVRPDLAIAEFIAAFMRSETFLRRASIVTTTGQLPRIGTEQIAAVTIELPPLDVQRDTVEALTRQLDAVGAAQVAAEEQLAMLGALPAALLRSIFGRS